ncbi:hypothetical protein BIW11_09596 [Tropilaelaps mercedesae]|uniref:Uncharacterized protein n=1 Tax=Tropilaelaps mercedesae TaxID=418985 RepID=A0A1V9XJN3_9ACAR|nr:hypothetical protein BIW11_09596 [Tropilaelaps mercedesae]
MGESVQLGALLVVVQAALVMCSVLPTTAMLNNQLLSPHLQTQMSSSISRVSATANAEPQEMASLLRPVDPSEPDALLKFVVSELERSKREAGTLASCEGIEVAGIISRPRQVENGVRYAIELKVKPVHIVTDKCNNNAVKDIIPSTLEECQLEVWEGMEPAGEMHPMAMLKSTCKLQKD